MRGMFSMVREMLAQDPAYRPTYPPTIRLNCGGASRNADGAHHQSAPSGWS